MIITKQQNQFYLDLNPSEVLDLISLLSQGLAVARQIQVPQNIAKPVILDEKGRGYPTVINFRVQP